ncbi:hypothetical protein [Crocosphaera sp. Alani8]|uniref:hypothetical protein n=1 Tax=Crocosphaera sp. Alani8 TaxID=3038952 RepID=UPI00313D2631
MLSNYLYTKIILQTNINPNDIVNILNDEDVRKSIQKILNIGTPFTDKKFLILGFAITLSIYLSNITREIINKILDDITTSNIDKQKNCFYRINSWSLLVITDFILWSSIIIPLSIITNIWFLTLPSTNFMFGWLRWWTFLELNSILAIMGLFDGYESHLQASIINSHFKNIKIKQVAIIQNYSIPARTALLLFAFIVSFISK